MKRKRFIKMAMGRGISRNAARFVTDTMHFTAGTPGFDREKYLRTKEARSGALTQREKCMAVFGAAVVLRKAGVL